MQIVLVAPTSIEVPPKKYGGTQRVVYWLAKGLSELGHKVTIIGRKGSYVNEKVRIVEVNKKLKNSYEYLEYIPENYDIVNFHIPLDYEPDYPYLMTMHGNAREEKPFFPVNTSFVSRSHAANHGRKLYIYNGLDMSEYEFCAKPDDYFSYLSKISLKKKNVKYAVKLAKELGFELRIGGGWRFSLNRNIKYMGMVGGKKKIDLLKKAKGLIFPTNWEEPMGLVVIESLACGAPVIVSDKGAMPELVDKRVGFVCKNEEEYIYAIKNVEKIDREYCRQYVREKFSHKFMAKNYLDVYEQIIDSKNYKLK